MNGSTISSRSGVLFSNFIMCFYPHRDDLLESSAGIVVNILDSYHAFHSIFQDFSLIRF